MSQNPLAYSGTKSPKIPELKPVLAAALASLEVQLDQELARYRRTRFTYKTLNQTRIGIPSHSKLQQMGVISTTGANTPSPIVNKDEEISLPQFPITTPPISELSETQEQEQISAVVTEDPTQQQISVIPSLPTPNSANIVPASNRNNQSDNLVKPEAIPKPPDDYLESSEALLRSLTEEQSPTNKRSNSGDSLLSPLGIGSMLLLLMASLTLGYVLFNPKSLPQLSLGGLFQKNSPTSEPPTTNQKPPTNNQQPELTPIPKFPNLASSEFPEVKNPNDVVALTPQPKIAPVLIPGPVPTQTPQIPPQNTQQPPTNKQQSTINTKQKLDDTEIKPSVDGLYHIFTDNQSDETFAKVRQVIPDAYLSKDKKLIYLGAFKTQKQVEKHRQMLQAKGIETKVQQPQ